MPRSFRFLGDSGKNHRTKKAQAKKILLWKKVEFRVTGDSKPPVGRNQLFSRLRNCPIKQHIPY